MNIVGRAIHFGSVEGSQPQLQRRILFSNVIYLTLIAVYFIYFLLDFKVYLQPLRELKIDQWTVPLIILYCLGGLYLNSIGRTYLSRVVFLILWPLLLHILPIIYLNTPADYYLAYPLGLILHAVFIQFLISVRCEPRTFWILLITNFAAIILARQFLFINDSNPEIIMAEGVVNSGYYSLILVLYWLLFNFITFYILHVLDTMIDKISGQQVVLRQSNEELLKLLASVKTTNKELELQLNQYQSEMEQVASTYAHYNAHSIRGPYCRIKGILMLREIQAIEDDAYELNLQQSLKDLELAISKMQLEMDSRIEQLSFVNKDPETGS